MGDLIMQPQSSIGLMDTIEGDKLHHIIEDMRHQYGVNISYDKAWHAREIAFALARGMQQGIMNGTHLKGKYKGTMIVGIPMDGNNQLYPLAYVIVDSENDRALKWFMTTLKTTIGECPNLVFVSNYGQSIANIIDIVFPRSYHGLCTFHLKRNVEKYFKDESVRKLFHDACRAYRELEFKRHWVQIVNYNNGSLARYLEDADIQRWARCYQSGNRYDNMTSNSVECFNAITKEARVSPITLLLEYIRGLLQGWFHEWQTMWSNCTSKCRGNNGFTV
ncbi:uncharacterized protein LOC120084506 [Benincasa hispida]|uniref:uncharacterized protein LOC120084506 n=1 Tax=Benincasa hispida TaxID=102211 RepID=UPI001901954C|nr:uncharacterized protein LOC120084506 [Benincasa hispida]